MVFNFKTYVIIIQACAIHLQAIVLNIRLPKQSTVGDVLNEIKSKVSKMLDLCFFS